MTVDWRAPLLMERVAVVPLFPVTVAFRSRNVPTKLSIEESDTKFLFEISTRERERERERERVTK